MINLSVLTEMYLFFSCQSSMKARSHFWKSSAPSGRDTGSHHGMLHHSVITENHSQHTENKATVRCPAPFIHLQYNTCTQGSGHNVKWGRGRAERLWEPEDPAISCEIVFWKCQKSYTHEGSAAWLPQPDLNEYSTNRQANIGDGNLTEATHIQRHRWSATKSLGNGRNISPQEWAP